jgi:hypothetical protein
MDNTIIQQGSFTGTGVAQAIILRSDVDWMEVINMTNVDGAVINAGTRYYWQREMLPAHPGIYEFHGAASNVTNLDTLDTGFGFQLIDSSTYAISAPIAVTAGTNVTNPVYSTANTLGMADHAIVRLVSTDQTDLNGLDFTVTSVVTNTSFTMNPTLATAPGVVAGANGFYRLIAPNLATYKLFYPSVRVICSISQAANAEVVTLVDHGYTIGQKVRINIGDSSGMPEINGKLVTILSITSSSSFTIDLDTTGYTAFTFPTAAIYNAYTIQYATVNPVGEEPTTVAGKIPFGDAVFNQGFIGMVLNNGAAGDGSNGPSGASSDFMIWKAGKSFNV